MRLRGSAEQRRLGLGHRRLPLAPGGIGASLYCAGCEPQRAGMCGARRPPGTLRRLWPGRDAPVTFPCPPRCLSSVLWDVPGAAGSMGPAWRLHLHGVTAVSIDSPAARPSGRRVRVRDAPAAPAPGGDAEPGPGCCTPPGVHLPLAPQLRHPLLCNSATSGAKQDRDRDGTWLRLHLQSGGFGAHSPARLTFSRLKKRDSPPIKRL